MYEKKIIFLSILTGLIVGAAAFVASNLGNHSVDGGYVAYVYDNPIWGRKTFKECINGPGGTGYWRWRNETLNISVTPWTMEEDFDDILAADKLRMKAQASLIFHIDRTRVRDFVENYGAMAEVDRTPKSIITDAYDSFIKQHFRTLIRAEVSKYKGLDASAKIPEITASVERQLRERMEGKPFVIESVTIGHTTPPESVTNGVTLKVEKDQENERKLIEAEIAANNVKIQEAEGQAIARKAEQEAQGRRLVVQQEADAAFYKAQQEARGNLFRAQQEAEGILAVARAEAEGEVAKAAGIKAQSDALNPLYVAREAVKNLDKLKLPDTYVSAKGLGAELGDIVKSIGEGVTAPAAQ